MVVFFSKMRTIALPLVQHFIVIKLKEYQPLLQLRMENSSYLTGQVFSKHPSIR